MLFFWWTGRGYLAPVILAATAVVASIFLAAVKPANFDGRLFWGSVAIIAAGTIWFVGSRINAKARAKKPPASVRERLLYRPRNRFMSLPLETSSLPLAAIGLGIVVSRFFD